MCMEGSQLLKIKIVKERQRWSGAPTADAAPVR